MNVLCPPKLSLEPVGLVLFTQTAPTSVLLLVATNCIALGAQPVRCEPMAKRPRVASRMSACPSMSGPLLTMPVVSLQSALKALMPANLFSTERIR